MFGSQPQGMRHAKVLSGLAENSSQSRQAQGHSSESTSWQQVERALYLPYELMGFAEGSGLLFLAGGAGRNPYYDGN